MVSLGEILKHPDELYPLLKLKMVAINAQKQIPRQPHWRFCFAVLRKFSKTFAFVIEQLPAELCNAVCILYLVLRALDTVEDDTSIPTDVKVPILKAFHRNFYGKEWRLSLLGTVLLPFPDLYIEFRKRELDVL